MHDNINVDLIIVTGEYIIYRMVGIFRGRKLSRIGKSDHFTEKAC